MHESHCVITIPKESFILNMGNHSLVISTDIVIDLQSRLRGGLYDKPSACDRVVAHVSVARQKAHLFVGWSTAGYVWRPPHPHE